MTVIIGVVGLTKAVSCRSKLMIKAWNSKYLRDNIDQVGQDFIFLIRFLLHCYRQSSARVHRIQVNAVRLKKHVHLLPVMGGPVCLKSLSYNRPLILMFLSRWVDNKKCIFSVEIEAVTSVHTENEQLDTFLSKTAGLQLGQKPARVADQVKINIFGSFPRIE